MLRFTALAPSILMVILLLTISRAMAEGPITVYTPKIPNEQNSLVSTESVNVAPGRSEIRKFSDGFTSIHIGNPKIVDATPINDRSDPDVRSYGYFTLHNKALLNSQTNFRCRYNDCQYVGETT